MTKCRIVEEIGAEGEKPEAHNSLFVKSSTGLEFLYIWGSAFRAKKNQGAKKTRSKRRGKGKRKEKGEEGKEGVKQGEREKEKRRGKKEKRG